MKKIKKAETLMDEGRECLYWGDYKGARKIGKMLLKLKYSGGYELIAESYYQNGRLDKAIKILEKSLETINTVWFLWYLHGVYMADSGDFEKSYTSFNKAIGCTDCDILYVQFEQSRALSKQGRNDEAIQLCENILGEIHDANLLKSNVVTHLISLLIDANQLDKSIAIGIANLDSLENNELSADDDVDTSVYEADVLSRIAQAYFLKNDLVSAGNYILKALGIVHCHEYSLSVLRRINDLKSHNSKFFSILVRGKLEWEKELPFFKKYGVIADNKNEAIEFIRYVLSAYKGIILEIDEVEIIEDSPNEYKGVYSSPGFTFYDSNLKKQRC